MTLNTSRGLTLSDQAVLDYFSAHPAYAQVANDAAGLGLNADQLAYALSLGLGGAISAAAVNAWVAAPGSGYTWAPDGTLAHGTLILSAPGSAAFTMIDATGAQTLDIVSTTSNSMPSTVTDTLTLSTTAHTTLDITGNAALDLSPNWEIALMSVKTVSAGTFDAGLRVYLYGNTNDLHIAVGNGNNIVVAGFGSDTIATGAGDDIIFAGRAADIVDAGAGNDWIRGGPAKDVMTGGTGIDTYAYVFAYESSDSTGVDVITDFAAGAGGDLLDFTALTHGSATFAGNVNGTAAVNAALHAGSIRAVFDKTADVLHVDLDANGVLDATNDIAIQLTGVSQLVGADIIF
jgi:Ca2+-binding RTX toxin-like protein